MKNSHPDQSIKQQIRRLPTTMLPVMGGIMILLICMLLSISSQYRAVLQSANTAADFSKELKTM